MDEGEGEERRVKCVERRWETLRVRRGTDGKRETGEGKGAEGTGTGAVEGGVSLGWGWGRNGVRV